MKSMLRRARAVTDPAPLFPTTTLEELLGGDVEDCKALWNFAEQLQQAGKLVDAIYVWHRIAEIAPYEMAWRAERNILFCFKKLEDLDQPTYAYRPVNTWLVSARFRFARRFQDAYQKGLAMLRADPDFQALTALRPQHGIEWAVHVLIWAAQNGLNLEGDFVECGTWLGTYARAICEYLDFAKQPRKFYMFDTFCGGVEEMALEEEKVNSRRQGYMGTADIYERAVEQFAGFPNVELVRGVIPESLPSVPIEKVAFIHIDMNMAAPEIAAITYFWDKLSTGACVVLDDYARLPYYKQQQAWDVFAREHGVSVCYLPTGQGLIIKT